MALSHSQHPSQAHAQHPNQVHDATPLLTDASGQRHPHPVGSRSRAQFLWHLLILAWRFTIFAVTGSTSVFVTRYIMGHVLGMKG
ncbi:hypothetical protein BC938DRAFT_472599 [Jimgerdemannia flammicorona]|uniref:Uncharacterized protein n=1 Tax=Jimgerdemannia flammicorona TaxID=994334 RepID=A0A433Q5R9_9FUNG|nr:hypothetical protein BC938DRAFT_472599 [Jimgerdemannia flammicorona]